MAAPPGTPWCCLRRSFYSVDKLRVVSNVEPQFLYDLSDRQVEGQLNLHLACKWFAERMRASSLQPEEAGPDPSALGGCSHPHRFRARLEPEKFQAIFNQIVQQARAAGLVHDRLRIIDATHLAAKVDLFRLPPTPAETPLAQAPGSPDPEACFGRKSATKSFYGYPSTWLRAVSLSNRKEHLATDADSELITAGAVTPGNVADSEEFVGLVDPRARDVTADKGYDTNANHQKLKRRGQRSSIILKKNRTNPQVLGQANPASQRERANIARKFAEQQQYHGLRQARYWGLRRVTIQVLITCLVVNCKENL